MQFEINKNDLSDYVADREAIKIEDENFRKRIYEIK